LLQNKLRCATLTIAILVLFLILTLAALFGLVLAGLATLLTLSGLSTLLSVSRLALSELVALLTFLLHVVCHKPSS
jgi:hypothetical protein